MRQAGIINGKANKRFDPSGKATRAVTSAVLHRFVELVIDESTARGWSQLDDGTWQYYNWQGKQLTDWQTIDGEKYYFDISGVMQIGWNKASSIGKKYYFAPETGIMSHEEWVLIDGKHYYFYKDGTLAISTTVGGYTVDQNGVRKAHHSFLNTYRILL